MQNIKTILDDNNVNSTETLALLLIDSLSITYNEDVITINNAEIRLSTVIAKLLADNVKHLSSDDFFSMLAAGYTNSKKMKREQKGIINVKKATEAGVKLDVTGSSSSYEISAYTQIAAFHEELELLCGKYGYKANHILDQEVNIFNLYHRETYLALALDETVDSTIVDRLLSVDIDTSMLSRRAPYTLLQLDITPKMVGVIVGKLTSIDMMLVTMPYLHDDLFNFLIEEVSK